MQRVQRTASRQSLTGESFIKNHLYLSIYHWQNVHWSKHIGRQSSLLLLFLSDQPIWLIPLSPAQAVQKGTCNYNHLHFIRQMANVRSNFYTSLLLSTFPYLAATIDGHRAMGSNLIGRRSQKRAAVDGARHVKSRWMCPWSQRSSKLNTILEEILYCYGQWLSAGQSSLRMSGLHGKCTSQHGLHSSLDRRSLLSSLSHWSLLDRLHFGPVFACSLQNF